jgi:NADPH:quinone reductase-like Zn-dependent oxidoreductase
MKSLKYYKYGEPEKVLVVNDAETLPSPGNGEVVVRVTERMVHPIDELMIRGIVPLPISEAGLVPGGDGVGVIEVLGPGVTETEQIRVGTRVGLFHGAHGTWAEYVTARAEDLILLPDDISDETACQIMINGITAATLLREACSARNVINEAGPVLITAAGSSVGRNLIALALKRGLKVIATVRSKTSADILTNAFSDIVVVETSNADWKTQTRGAYGIPPKVAIDPIGGAMTADLLDILADRGTLLTYGGMDHSVSQLSSITFVVRGLTLKGVSAPEAVQDFTDEERAQDLQSLFDVVRNSPELFENYRKFSLSEAVKAINSSQETPRRDAILLSTEA